MSTTRVLVTGASGFLGVATREALERAGAEALATDTHASAGVTPLDVTNPAEVENVLATTANDGGLHAVVHLAAAGFKDQGLVAGAAAETARAVHVNVEGFVNVVEAAARHGVRHVVWSSSTTIYGPAAEYGTEPVTEDVPLRPQTAYGVTKTACEHLGPILADRWNINITSLRLPMVYGPGRWYGGSQQGLVDLVRELRTGRPSGVTAWAGEADWIHIDDSAAALSDLALRTLGSTGRAFAYHVLGHRSSYADLARALVRHAGQADDVDAVAGGAPDIPAIDDHELRRATGFTPRISTVEAGAATYFDTHLPAATREVADREEHPHVP